MIVPENDEPDLRFDPVALQRGPAASAGWLPVSMLGPAPDENAFARVGRVIDGALSEGDAWHAAILVAHHGHLVGEGYGKGIDADMPLESWSMGKSVMSTLIGLLVGRGALDLDAPAPVAAWQTDGDPRRRITLRHLLTMSSGLRCTGYQEPRANWSDNMPEHFHPYTEAIDVARFATERPAEVTAGKIGRYRNCDPLTLATIFDERVRALGGIPQSFPQTELFTPLGMHGLTHETDRWGRFIISGFNYGTARDWARLGHLYLHDGVWDGKRILPEGWVDFVRDPAPAWEEGNYGGQFWLNTDGEYPLPRDTFYMAGGGGQFVFVVPSHDLVIVRQGHSRGWAESKPNVKALLAKLLEAIGLTPA
ncbi:MAG: CubicO group peptidase, beta-lactamase class C family [Rhodobacteraceae bacterium HLUCCA24]|nr:MAG: CubicO group peptidase, beta-lactamase class C family [Rhodobacteraceae bacterium HLUCCA24]